MASHVITSTSWCGLVSLLLGVASPASGQVDQQRAEAYFKEAAAICRRDGGRLWGVSLCGPMVIADARTGDARWLDHQGSFMAAVAAQPVYRLLGARDMGVKEGYRTARMPAVNVALLDGQLAWRQHDGGHTDGPNWKYFIPWADRMLGHTPPDAAQAGQ